MGWSGGAAGRRCITRYSWFLVFRFGLSSRRVADCVSHTPTPYVYADALADRHSPGIRNVHANLSAATRRADIFAVASAISYSIAASSNIDSVAPHCHACAPHAYGATSGHKHTLASNHACAAYHASGHPVAGARDRGCHHR
ncbi:MAG: hypothetical protein Kow0063_09340 [Anaerolineae bacterium]